MCNTLKKPVSNNRGDPEKREGGYTLIEMSVVIVIAAIMMLAGLSLYDIYRKNQQIINTEQNIVMATNALGNFRAINGYYPCPASPTLNRTSPLYGRQGDCTGNGPPVTAPGAAAAPFTVAVGTCDASGFCAEQSERDLGGGDFPKVVRGALPFRDLNLPEQFAYDGYGSRYMYAVTERLADPARYEISQGGISIVNDAVPEESLLEEPGSGHFLIFSPGVNRVGGYNRTGALMAPCADGGTMEVENCNAGATEAKYVKSMLRATGNAGHYDDRMSFFSEADTPLWQFSANDRNNIHQRPYSGFVAIRDDDENPDLTVTQVEGRTRAREDVKLTEICGKSGAPDDCFSPAYIAGDVMDECPAGSYMTGIENKQIQCASYDIVCPGGKMMTGVKPDGKLKCEDPPPRNCGEYTTYICSDVTVPAGKHGTIYKINDGANAWRKFKCDDGTWYEIDGGGQCTCDPTSKTRTLSCASGFSGSIKQVNTYQCPQGVWTGWVTTEDTCTCVPNMKTRNLSCNFGFDGTVTQVNTFQCPQGKWTGWATTENTCTCVGDTRYRNAKCPAGYNIGQIIEEQTLTCNADGTTSLSSWTLSSSTCACEEKTVTDSIGCSDGLVGKIYRENKFVCPEGTWTGWQETSNDCTCEEKKKNRNVDCPEGMVGLITEEQSFTCSGNVGTWSDWYEVENTCKTLPPPACTWFTSGTVGGPVTNKPSGMPAAGDSCSCSSDTTTTCYQVIQAGISYQKYNCTCK